MSSGLRQKQKREFDTTNWGVGFGFVGKIAPPHGCPPWPGGEALWEWAWGIRRTKGVTPPNVTAAGLAPGGVAEPWALLDMHRASRALCVTGQDLCLTPETLSMPADRVFLP